MHAAKSLILASVLLAASTVTAARAGESISDPELGFRLTVPDGFAQTSVGVGEPTVFGGDVVYSFERPSAGDGLGTFVLVSRLEGVICREKIDRERLAAKYPHISVSTARWKGFEIEVFRVPERLDGVEMLNLNAQVPLEPAAVMVSVVGEAAEENVLRSVLASVLGSLEGKSNWTTTPDGKTEAPTTPSREPSGVNTPRREPRSISKQGDEPSQPTAANNAPNRQSPADSEPTRPATPRVNPPRANTLDGSPNQPGPLGGETISDSRLGFRLTVPQGFVRSSAGGGTRLFSRGI